MDEAKGVSSRLTLEAQLRAPTLTGSYNWPSQAHAGVRQRASCAGVVSVLLLYLCPQDSSEECYSIEVHHRVTSNADL